MPYYIYKLIQNPIVQMKKIEQHDEFRVASARAKELRRELALTEQCAVKMVLAENELVAEDLLSQVREPDPVLGDD